MTNINLNCAKLLYIISNYEKMRIKSSGIWGIKYIESFRESIKIMDMLIKIVSNKNLVSKNDISTIQKYIDRNIGIIFQPHIVIDVFYIFQKENPISNDYTAAISLMNTIVTRLDYLLNTKPKKYKIEVSYLIKAFHNLPRAFFDITELEAIMYANSYLSKIT